MKDILDVIKNIQSIYESDMAFTVLKDFERVLDDLDIYVYENWADGELVSGPNISRHWVTCSFMWDRDKMPDEISAEYAVNILKQKHDRPFYLGVGFVRPHTPLFAPKKYFDLYPLEDITLPPILEGDLDDCSEALRNRCADTPRVAQLPGCGGEVVPLRWGASSIDRFLFFLKTS